MLVLEPSEARSLLESLPGAEGLLLREGAEPLATSGWERAVRYEPLAIRTETSRVPDRSG